MTTNFRFIAHTTEGHAHEFAVGGVRNRLRQRGFTHARRTDQAQHRALNLLHALLHGEVFENPLFDFFETVVIGVENVFGAGQVQT